MAFCSDPPVDGPLPSPPSLPLCPLEQADRLVGIYKTDNATKTVTINPAEFTVQGPKQDGAKKKDVQQEADQDEKAHANPTVPDPLPVAVA